MAHPKNISLFQDQKKLQGQLIAEQEALFGSKPSPSKPQNVKKATFRGSTGSTGGNRRLSVGGAMIQTPKPDPINSTKATPKAGKKNDRYQTDQVRHCQDDGFSALSAGRCFLCLEDEKEEG